MWRLIKKEFHSTLGSPSCCGTGVLDVSAFLLFFFFLFNLFTLNDYAALTGIARGERIISRGSCKVPAGECFL